MARNIGRVHGNVADACLRVDNVRLKRDAFLVFAFALEIASKLEIPTAGQVRYALRVEKGKNIKDVLMGVEDKEEGENKYFANCLCVGILFLHLFLQTRSFFLPFPFLFT